MNLAVLIPALDEEQSIGRVIGDLPSGLVDRIVVVDNGSTDSTARVARQAGAEVVSETQRGYGAACLRGLSELGAEPPDVVVFLDGDYSDHPDELQLVAGPVLEGDADFVVGSRMSGRAEKGALLPQARFGNWLACFLMRQVWGVTYTDLGPFRAIRYPLLRALDMQDTTFGWTIEMQIKAAEAGLRIQEVPVSYRRRVGVSKITGTVTGTVKASAKILWTIGRMAATRRRRTAVLQHRVNERRKSASTTSA